MNNFMGLCKKNIDEPASLATSNAGMQFPDDGPNKDMTMCKKGSSQANWQIYNIYEGTGLI